MIQAIKITAENKMKISQAMGIGIDGLDTWFPDFVEKHCRDYFVKWDLGKTSWWIYNASELLQLFDFVEDSGNFNIQTQFVEVKER